MVDKSNKKTKNKKIAICIGITLCVEIVVCVILLLMLSKNGSSDKIVVASEGMYNIEARDLKSNATLKTWIEDCNNAEEKICAIISKESRVCIIYVKDSTKLMKSYLDYCYNQEENWGEAKIHINTEEYYDTFGYHFFMYNLDVCDEMDIEVEYDGEEMDINIIYTDADISYNTWGGVSIE